MTGKATRGPWITRQLVDRVTQLECEVGNSVDAGHHSMLPAQRDELLAALKAALPVSDYRCPQHHRQGVAMTTRTLSDRLLHVALTGRVPADDPHVIAEAQYEIEQLQTALAEERSLRLGAEQAERSLAAEREELIGALRTAKAQLVTLGRDPRPDLREFGFGDTIQATVLDSIDALLAKTGDVG